MRAIRWRLAALLALGYIALVVVVGRMLSSPRFAASEIAFEATAIVQAVVVPFLAAYLAYLNWRLTEAEILLTISLVDLLWGIFFLVQIPYMLRHQLAGMTAMSILSLAGYQTAKVLNRTRS